MHLVWMTQNLKTNQARFCLNKYKVPNDIVGVNAYLYYVSKEQYNSILIISIWQDASENCQPATQASANHSFSL